MMAWIDEVLDEELRSQWERNQECVVVVVVVVVVLDGLLLIRTVENGRIWPP